MPEQQNIPTSHNNPGDLKMNGQIAQFGSAQQGLAALYNDLTAKMTGTTTSGLGPSSSLVDFSKVWAPDSDGNNSLQYAANLANQLGVSPDTKIGTLLPKIDQFAAAIAHNEGYQGQIPSSQGNISVAQATGPGSVSAQAPKNALQKTGDVLKSVGNFLFPIAGDVFNDIRGTNNKSALQQAGDLGLSVLPFIPGLGEIGEGARAGALGLEAAEEGSRLIPGLVSRVGAKVAEHPILSGIGAGYATGAASNLSQGQSVPQALSPNLNTLSGALLGGAGAGIVSKIPDITHAVAGITPQIENALKDRGITLNEYNKFINAAKNHATNLESTTAPGLAGEALDNAASKITDLRQEAGAHKGQVLKQVGNQATGDPEAVIQQFKDHVADTFGIALTEGKNGAIKSLTIPGRQRVLEPGTRTAILKSFKQLTKLRGASLQEASDIASNIGDLVQRDQASGFGKVNTPINALVKKTDGSIRQLINESSPELAQANATFSGLKNMEKEIAAMAGDKLQRGGLLMRRVFSGEHSGDVQKLFNNIKQLTGIDLVNKAVLARHAINVAGDQSQKELLQQILEGSIAAHTGGLTGALLNVGKNVARKTISNPERIGRRLIKGKGLIQRGAAGVVPTAIESSRQLSGLLPLSH